MQKWDKRHLLWCIVDWIPTIERPVQALVFQQSFAAWSAVCGLTFNQTTDADSADFLILTREIDGEGGTLATHQLPHKDRPLRGFYDLEDKWGTIQPPTSVRIDLGTVAKHEIGHGVGLPHTNVPRSLMNSRYDSTINVPQAWEIAEAVKRYGPSIGTPTPEPDIPVEVDYPIEIIVRMSSGASHKAVKFTEVQRGAE